jgi:Mce-associated membrane protein
VEVAAGGPGGGSVTPDPDRQRSRLRLNLVLYVVALVTAAVCVVVTVAVVRDLRDDGPTALPPSGALRVESLEEAPADEQARLGDVLAAATEVATAFVNIRYDDAQASIDQVKAGATGAFREQYEKSTGGVIEVIERNKSVMTGEVLWAGVVDVDEDSATVIVATSGTVANKQTGDKPVARSFRLQLELVKEADAWLTSDLQFVA